MIHFSRLRTLNTLNKILAGGAMLAGVAPLLHPPAAAAQFVNLMQDSPAYLQHNSQGYLGVTLQDIDNDRAAALRLKEVKGAEIITVDHDAPAGKAGLQSHDVILQMNGQAIEGAEQLRRMLREMPPGRAVSFVISRDGQPVNLSAQLVDRRDLDREIWGKHVNQPEPDMDAPYSSFAPNGSTGGPTMTEPWSMHFGSSFSVGAVVDPLTAQLANYFGATEGTGLLVKSVDGKSPAAVAGLRAGDIVLKVNDDTMATRADWQRILRANEGKQVQVTVLRDKKQQLLTMQAGNTKKKSALEMPDTFTPGLSSEESREMVAELRDLRESLSEMDPDAIAAQARAAVGNIDVDAIRKQAERAIKNIDADAIRKQAEQAANNIDVDELRKQAQEAMKNIDVDAIRAQAEQATRQIETMKKQLEEMKQQLDQSRPQ